MNVNKNNKKTKNLFGRQNTKNTNAFFGRQKKLN